MNLHDNALGVRWSIGDVSDDGYEALQLSVWGAHRIFGPRAAYVVCVHDATIAEVQAKTGGVPDGVRWQHVQRHLPQPIAERISGEDDAREIGWRLSPPRLFPDRFELSLDNECILWDLPVTIASWLDDAHPSRCLLVEDVSVRSGKFAGESPTPLDACIRGLPPGFDLEAALVDELARTEGNLVSDLDEVGLQVAALSRHEPPCVVPLTDVTVCSPFPPHHLALGRCGAHFVGIDAKRITSVAGKSDDEETEHLRAHWRHHRQRLFELVGLVREREIDRSATTVQSRA